MGVPVLASVDATCECGCKCGCKCCTVVLTKIEEGRRGPPARGPGECFVVVVVDEVVVWPVAVVCMGVPVLASVDAMCECG
jgi:hypothetical protein